MFPSLSIPTGNLLERTENCFLFFVFNNQMLPENALRKVVVVTVVNIPLLSSPKFHVS